MVTFEEAFLQYSVGYITGVFIYEFYVRYLEDAPVFL